MDFYKGKPLEVKASFNVTRKEAYVRACALASDLMTLIGNRKFSVRVDRLDTAAKGYEVGPVSRTIDS